MTKTKKNGAAVGPGRKRSYAKSTPLIRLRNNVDKIDHHAGLCLDRLTSWAEGSDGGRLARAVELVREVAAASQELGGLVDDLETVGFVPERKSPVWQPAPGENVRVADEYRDKYGQIYATELKDDPEMLDGLVVHSVLESGEIVVRRGKRTPFAVRKSHLVAVR